jgi:peptide-methionine (S)-S-oxide reductase
MEKDKATETARPATATPQSADSPSKIATFGAGCFWGVEAAYRQLPGVLSTRVGYLGGTMANPTYADVCSGRTGHAEVVEVTYDPARLTYDDLLSVFWENHDPTTLNRQGPDVGEQYRSAIFYHDHDQEIAALASKEGRTLSGKYHSPIVTEVTPASTFFKAEDYHQQYLEKRGLANCQIG